MRILAFDTAMAGCSAAFMDTESGSCVSETKPMPRGQAEELVPMIKRVTGTAGFPAVDLIAVTTGPGAFTGLRIGLSTARALGLALGRPVTGVTTLEVFARQFFNKEKLNQGEILAVLLETKREDFYIQIFGPEGKALSGPEALDVPEIIEKISGKKVAFAGDALARFQALRAGEEPWRFVENYDLPDPAAVALLAAELYGRSGGNQPAAVPLYLRGADVSRPKNPPRVLAE